MDAVRRPDKAHASHIAELVRTASFHDGLQDCHWPVKNLLAGGTDCTGDIDLSRRALYRHAYLAFLHLIAVDGPDLTFELCDGFACRRHFPDLREANFAVGANF